MKMQRRMLAGILGLGLVAGAIQAAPQGPTMLVVPARYTVLQVAFDINRVFPSVLVSYQGDASTAEPLLYAWNGKEWVYVSLTSYAEASFLGNPPSRIILVGDAALLPPVLVESSAWCPNVYRIQDIDTPRLVNSLARAYDFKDRDWAWFAGRYNLTLVDVNQDKRAQSWYDGSMPVKVMPDGREERVYVPPQGQRQEVIRERETIVIDQKPSGEVIETAVFEEEVVAPTLSPVQ